MWIKEPLSNHKEDTSFNSHVVFLWKDDKRPIYVSDNHLTAAWCWLQECEPNRQYNFMHIDRHVDLSGKGEPTIIEGLKDNPKISFGEFLNFEYNNGYTFQFFQWDNFIRAIHHLFPQWFQRNLFYVYEDLDETMDAKKNGWGYADFPFVKRNVLYLRDDITGFIEKGYLDIDKEIIINQNNISWIVSLDLDFFWDDDSNVLYDEESIRDFAQRINKALPNIKVLTIALSPDCVGGNCLKEKWENALGALNIFKEELSLNINI